MAGFVLPKLRWLVIGAVAAGAWAVTQEPVGKKEQRDAPRPAASQGILKQRQSPPSGMPKLAVRPKTRPSKLVTSSIKRPDKPVSQLLFTASRVRLRDDASTAARVVTWLEAGEEVTVLERSGKWRRVTVGGRNGWVHGDYLQSSDPDVPRPKGLVAQSTGTEAKKTVPASSQILPTLFLSKRPARPAQRGDCQCPYDLMINGKECGDRSAYVMRGRASAHCYL
jgi:Bacterial SH3 domain